MGIFYLLKHNLNNLASNILQILFVKLCSKVILTIFTSNKNTGHQRMNQIVD